MTELFESTVTATFIVIDPESQNYFEKRIGETTATTFGVLSIKFCRPEGVCPKPVIINAAVDNSYSMDAIVSDLHPHSQQQLVNTIMKNLTKKIATTCPGTSITIASFDDAVAIVQPLTEISEETVEGIKQNIDTIVPNGSTNIELPIKHLKKTTLENEKPGSVCNIMLTDGVENAGESDPAVLAKELCQGASYAFVGVGLECNHVLLGELASKTPDGKGEFYFIKELEDVPLIMGKIFAEFLYTLASQIKITIENGEIYNFETNTWSSSIYVPKLIHGITRNFHLRTNAESIGSVSISIEGTDDLSSTFCKVFGQEHIVVASSESMMYEMARFETLRALHRVLIDTIEKIELKEMFEKIEQGYSDKKLFKRLTNNLFLAYKYIDSPYFAQICLAQIKTNGNETAFIHDFEPVRKQFNFCDPPSLFINHCLDLGECDYFGDVDINYKLLPLFSKEHSSEEEIMFMTSAGDGFETRELFN